MSIPLIAGRTFTDADLSGNPPVAIVPRATAERFWGDDNPLGRQFKFAGETHWHTVVGVVGDVRAYDLQRDVPECIVGTVYVPYSPQGHPRRRSNPAEMTIAVATSADAAHLEATLRQIIAGLRQEIPISDVRAMRTTSLGRRGIAGVRDHALRRVRRPGARARRDRHLRRAVLPGVETDAGDRHPHRARRAAAGRLSVGHEGRRAARVAGIGIGLAAPSQ